MTHTQNFNAFLLLFISNSIHNTITHLIFDWLGKRETNKYIYILVYEIVAILCVEFGIPYEKLEETQCVFGFDERLDSSFDVELNPVPSDVFSVPNRTSLTETV